MFFRINFPKFWTLVWGLRKDSLEIFRINKFRVSTTKSSMNHFWTWVPCFCWPYGYVAIHFHVWVSWTCLINLVQLLAQVWPWSLLYLTPFTESKCCSKSLTSSAYQKLSELMLHYQLTLFLFISDCRSRFFQIRNPHFRCGCFTVA